jgi:exonuclease SbcC
MMNLKSDELLIDFIFETGKNQTSYRATVKGRRNSKRFEDVKKLDRAAYRKTDNKWVPIEPSTLETAIGLSYENFKRTIIIPQGQFQEFLQLGNKDRTQMMKELFNLEKFEFYHNVTALESDNNEKKQNIEGQLHQLGVVDPGQLEAYETRKADLQKNLASENDKLTKLRTREQQWQQLRDLHAKLEKAQNELGELTKQVPHYTALETKINRYEQCLVAFRHLIDTLKSIEEKASARRQQIKIDSEKLKAEKVDIEKLEKSLSEIKPAYDKREELKQKADELLRVTKIIELDKSIASEGERLKKGDAAIKEKDVEIQKVKDEKTGVEGKLKSLKASLPDMNELANAKSWHVENQSINKQIREAKNELECAEAEIKKTHAGFQEVLKSIPGLEGNNTTEDVIAFLRGKIIDINEKQKNLDHHVNNLNVKDQLQKYAENLHDGDPCPLCGSKHHPEIFSAGEIKTELEKLNARKINLEKDAEQCRESIEKIKEQESHLKFNRQQFELINNKLKKLNSDSESHKTVFKWPKYENEQQLALAFQNASEAQKKIKETEARLDKITDGIDKKIAEKERYTSEIEKIRTTVTGQTSEVKTLSSQLIKVSAEEYRQKAIPDIQKEKEALIEKYKKLGKKYEEINNQLTTHRKKQDILTGSLEANKKELAQEKDSIVSLSGQLEEQLRKSAFDTLAEVNNILAQPINLGQEKANVTNFKEKLSEWKNQTKNVEEEINGREYNPEAHEKLKVEIQSLSEQANQKNQELGRVEELLNKLKIDIEKQKDLRKQLDALGLRGENIKTLKSLFKASGFVNYISSVYLQNLCNAANDRFFRLTRQKLSLEIMDDNNFIVRDYMNGGKTRSVKTLSGGQTFQAALSLALALADNIQKITESNQNFFFLDEGFGSLDKESLGVVFDTLKTLRKENRVVGVISHVEEMQQEIDIHLRIENDEKEGSLIRRSWEC